MLRYGVQINAYPEGDELQVYVSVTSWLDGKCESDESILATRISQSTTITPADRHGYVNRVTRAVARVLEDHFHDELDGSAGSDPEPSQLRIV
jgi:hypothetical protein